MNIIRTLLIVLTITAASISLAEAHAFLDHAEPKTGSSGPSPAQVKLFMTEELKAGACQVQVMDAKGTEVDRKDIQENGATMTVSVPALAPGTYTVAWKAVAYNGHRTSGTFSFTVQ